MELLFCDTFLNIPATNNGGWAVIKFPCMIDVGEIWVLPPHVKPHNAILKQNCTGQTHPDNFHVDFFSDNRSLSITTYERVGAMEYSTLSHNRFHPASPLYTEKLLLNGWFTSITVAVYGTILSSSGDSSSKSSFSRSLVIGIEGKSEGRRVYDKSEMVNEIDRHISDYRAASSYSTDKGRHRYDNVSEGTKHYNNQSLVINYSSDGTRDVHNVGQNDSQLLPKHEISIPVDYFTSPYFQQKNYNTNNYPPIDSKMETTENQIEVADGSKVKQWPSDYEDISEEDVGYDELSAMQELDEEDDLLFPSSMLQYNPFLIELIPLEHFSPPDISKFEEKVSKLINECPSDNQQHTEGIEENAEKSMLKITEIMKSTNGIIDIQIVDTKIDIILFNENCITQFLNAIEEILPLLHTELPEMLINECEFLAHELCGWALVAIGSSENIREMVGTNIRILKAGLKLVLELCKTFSDIVHLLVDNCLIDRLWEVLFEEHMASSTKVLIVHCLDALLDWPFAMDAFLHKYTFHDTKSNYAILIEMLISGQATRVANAISRLIKKINFYESLKKFEELVSVVCKNQIPPIKDEFLNVDIEEGECSMESEDDFKQAVQIEAGATKDEQSLKVMQDYAENMKIKHHSMQNEAEFIDNSEVSLNEENPPVPLKSVYCEESISLDENSVQDLIFYLKQITEMLSTSGASITQLPIKSFPVKSHLKSLSTDSTVRTIFRMLENFNVLISVQMLVTLPIISSINEIFESVYSFLDLLTLSQSGLLYLTFNFKTTVCIFRHLLCSSETFCRDEIETPGTASHMGAKLAFHLQCTQCLDQLNCMLIQDGSNEDDIVDVLRMMFSLSYTTFGKHWLCSVLNLSDHVLPLISCIKLNKEIIPGMETETIIEDKQVGSEEDAKSKTESESSEATKDKETAIMQEQKDIKKSAISGYAASILLIVIKMSKKVNYLKKHGNLIAEACAGLSSVPAAEVILKWLVESDKCLPSSSVTDLMTVIKNKTEKLEWSNLCSDGSSICTALRLLCHDLGISTCLGDEFQSNQEGATLAVLSAGGIPVFTEAISKLHKCLLYPCFSPHAIAHIHNTNLNRFTVDLACLLLWIIEHMVKQIFSTGSKEICAELIVNPIFLLFSQLYVLTKDTDLITFKHITQVILQIITTLGVCKPKNIITEKAKAERDISTNNNWKSIIRELTNFTEKSCEHFIPGLVLFLNILPLPLPVLITEDASNLHEIRDTVLKARHPALEYFKDSIKQLSAFFATLAHSTCLQLLEVLIPVYQQLIDLSHEFAVVLLSYLVKKLLIKNDVKKISEDGTEKYESSYIIQHQAILVASEISKHPPAKATLLQLDNFNDKVFPKLIEVILRPTTEDHNQAIKSTLLLVTSLLDTEISLVMGYESVLPQTHYSGISKLALKGLNELDLETINVSFKTLILLARYEKGFKCTKKNLTEATVLQLIAFLIKQLNSTDIRKLHMCFDVVESMIVFYNSLVEIPYESLTDFRRSVLTITDIRNLLCGIDVKPESSIFQLKCELEKYITVEDFFGYDTMFDELSSFCQTLQQQSNKENKTEIKPVKVDEGNLKQELLSLETQFLQRTIIEFADQDFTDDICHGIVSGEEENSFQFKNTHFSPIELNLQDMAEKHCHGYDLKNALTKLVDFADSSEIDRLKLLAKEKRMQKLETFSLRSGKSLAYMKRSHGLPNQLNIRSRGRVRGRPFNAGSRPYYDLFRQRKQNTSRPPSMHVDDFVAADQEEDETKNLFKSPHNSMQTTYRKSTPRNYGNREFVPRGRGRGSHTFTSPPHTFQPRFSSNNSFISKQRFRSSTNSPFNKFTERYNTGHRDKTFGSTITFSPHEGFKTSRSQWTNNSRGSGYKARTFRGSIRGRYTRGSKAPLFTSPKTFNPYYIKRGRGGYTSPVGIKQHSRSYTR